MARTKLVFSQADDAEYASQEELDQVKDNNTNVFVPATMNNKALFDLISNSSSSTFVTSGARTNKVTNSYLSNQGNFTNLVPFVLPFNATIKAISALASETGTWDAEIHESGTLITGATLSITAALSGYSASYDIDIDAGDQISLYCSGTNINKPLINVFFVRR